jgi:hypothetical protein
MDEKFVPLVGNWRFVGSATFLRQLIVAQLLLLVVISIHSGEEKSSPSCLATQYLNHGEDFSPTLRIEMTPGMKSAFMKKH